MLRGFKLQKNIGIQDRLIRLAIGIIFLAIAWWQWSWIFLICALFTFYEALVGWCALFQILGKNSCETQRKN